jgi:cellulose synthase/poly-beta-1,6-N-acetylglucosamine synthase-like glycosyltransferase
VINDKTGGSQNELRRMTHEGSLSSTLSEYPTTVDLILKDCVAVIVPARNESDQIIPTLESLVGQTRRPDMIVVVANNCTDNGMTAGYARSFAGVTVIEMDNNPHLKAGALNYGLRSLLVDGAIPEYIVTIDADTILAPDFIGNAVHVLAHQPKVGVVSAVCDGKNNLGGSWYQRALTALQRAEYARAGFTRIRMNIHTMSGAGAVIRGEAVRDVLQDRGLLFAETADNLVEDFELTLELKRHGWRCINNYYCRAETDLMMSVTALMKQRFRWTHGTINELRRRGWHRETRASIMTMWYALLSVFIFHAWPVLFVYHLLFEDVVVQDFWFIGLVMIFQAVSVHRLGWKMMLVAGLMVPDLIFGVIRNAWVVKSFFHSYARPMLAYRKLSPQMSW